MMNPRRTLVTGALAVLLASCGGDTAATLTLGRSSAESRSANAGTAMADSKLAVWAPSVTYVAGDALADPKWTDGVGRQRAWRYVAPSSPGKELARIASVLGVPGTVKEDAANKGSWSSEAMPGSPLFSSWGDEHGRWWSYTGSAVSPMTVDPSGSASSEPCPPDSKDCTTRPVDTVPPAENLPTKDEARKAALALLSKLGVDTDPGALSVDVQADDWSVRVSATALHEGEMSWVRSWYVGYGSDARLTDASGSMVTLEQADRYPVIDPVAAVTRLNEGLGLTGVAGWGAASRDIAVDSGSTTGEPPAPVEVTLVSARISLVDWSLADGTQMLLPAWALADEDGNEVKVVAVADKYIARPQVEPAPEPAPDPSVVPVPGSSGSGSSGSSGSSGGSDDVPAAAIREEDAQKLVGLGEDEATKIATGNGWTVRVAERDGESFMLTTDYRLDRVNLTVMKGVVTAVTIG